MSSVESNDSDHDQEDNSYENSQEGQEEQNSPALNIKAAAGITKEDSDQKAIPPLTLANTQNPLLASNMLAHSNPFSVGFAVPSNPAGLATPMPMPIPHMPPGLPSGVFVGPPQFTLLPGTKPFGIPPHSAFPPLGPMAGPGGNAFQKPFNLSTTFGFGAFANQPPVINKSDSVLSTGSQDDSHLVFPGLVKPPQSTAQASDEAQAQKANPDVFDAEYEAYKSNRCVQSKNPKLSSGNIYTNCFTHTNKFMHMSKEEVRTKMFKEGPQGAGYPVDEEALIMPLAPLGKAVSAFSKQKINLLTGDIKPTQGGLFSGGLFSDVLKNTLTQNDPVVKLFPQTGGLFNSAQQVGGLFSGAPQTGGLFSGGGLLSAPPATSPKSGEQSQSKPSQPLLPMFRHPLSTVPPQVPASVPASISIFSKPSPIPPTIPSQKAPDQPISASLFQPSNPQPQNQLPQNNKGELNLNLTTSNNNQFFSMTTTDAWNVQATGQNEGSIQIKMTSGGTTFNISYKRSDQPPQQPSVPVPLVASTLPAVGGIAAVQANQPANIFSSASVMLPVHTTDTKSTNLFNSGPKPQQPPQQSQAISSSSMFTSMPTSIPTNSVLMSQQNGSAVAQGSLFFNNGSAAVSQPPPSNP